MVAMLRYDLCESSLALKFALRHMTMFSVRPRPKNEEKLINKQSLQNFTDLQTNIYIFPVQKGLYFYHQVILILNTPRIILWVGTLPSLIGKHRVLGAVDVG